MSHSTSSHEEIPRAHLLQHPLFARFDEQQLERICVQAKVIDLEPGQMLFRQGDESGFFFLVLSGQVKLYRLSPSGDEKVIEVISSGSLFAEALMFSDLPFYPVSAQAMQASQVLRLDGNDFKALLAESVELCFQMMSDMSKRLHALVREIDDLSLHTAVGRLAGHLLISAPEDGSTFLLSMPKQTLASRLSIKPETFSRILKQLAREGVIEVEDSRIRILQRDNLLDIADTCALRDESLFESFK